MAADNNMGMLLLCWACIHCDAAFFVGSPHVHTKLYDVLLLLGLCTTASDRGSQLIRDAKTNTAQPASAPYAVALAEVPQNIHVAAARRQLHFLRVQREHKLHMAAHDECCSCECIRREAGKQACYTSVTLLQQAGTAKGQGKNAS